MLFRCVSFLYTHIRKNIIKRKETLSPQNNTAIIPPKTKNETRRRVFFFAPLQAGMTVEASIVFPFFLMLMLSVLQLVNVMEMAVRYSSALCETGEKIAAAAYASEYGDEHKVLTAGLSAVYARGSVLGKSGDSRAVKNISFLFSSFLTEDDMIHLVMTYQMRTPVGNISLPGIFFLQRASVRGWTGRKGSEGKREGEGSPEGDGEILYVTEHGTVYHTDLQCTHIRLSIHQVDRSSLTERRNRSGEIYHSCENCGNTAGSRVYITEEGNRYHASLDCSGLKRTVRTVSAEEAGTLRPCSRCGGA